MTDFPGHAIRRVAVVFACGALAATGALAQSPAAKAGADAGTAQAAVMRAEGGPDAQEAAAPITSEPKRGQVTNLPLPRYVSLKGSEGNARRGPSLSHRIDWVFRHAGMPLRVTAEYGHWRRVEDSDGAGGWVHYSLLSGVRTALVEQDMAELHVSPDEGSTVSARAQAGALVKLGACTPGWCQVTGGGVSGWLPKGQIWGVDPGEIRE